MNALKSAYLWVCNKLGRLITSAGFLVTLADLDISPVKGPLEELLGHKWVIAITVSLFLASYLRHRYVASLHPTGGA